MHVGSKSVVIADRVTPCAILAASTWLASRRTPDGVPGDLILTIRAAAHL
jgi:hypothetical protein